MMAVVWDYLDGCAGGRETGGGVTGALVDIINTYGDAKAVKRRSGYIDPMGKIPCGRQIPNVGRDY